MSKENAQSKAPQGVCSTDLLDALYAAAAASYDPQGEDGDILVTLHYRTSDAHHAKIVLDNASNADLSGGEAVRSDALLAALRSYLCQYTVDEDGNGLTLIDMLSPGETIADGELEIRLLADFISGMLQPKAS